MSLVRQVADDKRSDETGAADDKDLQCGRPIEQHSVIGAYLAISIIYDKTLLHLRKCSGKLDSMIVLESTAAVVSAQPGVAPSATLRLGQLPRLLPIIIQVAVPGPA